MTAGCRWALVSSAVMPSICKDDDCTKHQERWGYCRSHLKVKPDVPRCWFDGCSTIQLSTGLCSTHYGQRRRGEDLRPTLTANKVTCTGPECNRPARHRPGLCDRHYAQKRSHGEMWSVGTRRARGRPAIRHCVEDGCGDVVVARGRCCAHLTDLVGECWLPGCYAPGSHEKTGLCEEHINRQRRLLHDYRLTFQDLLKLYSAYDSKCGICGTPGHIVANPLHIDHCHKTLRVRGLLCGHCNRGIGLLNHDIDVLRSAITYLEVANGI